MTIKNGDKVKVEYTGKFDDGTVFDSSEGKQPLEFVVGEKKVIKGFDEAMVGMQKGEEKEFKLEPKDAYGDHNPQLVKTISKQNFPEGQEPKEGMMVAMKTKDGKQVPAKITKVEGDNVTIDLNFPLAGKNLNFKVKVVEVE